MGMVGETIELTKEQKQKHNIPLDAEVHGADPECNLSTGPSSWIVTPKASSLGDKDNK